ncbi:hypothetical protein [Sphingorhabdus rigui]|uniref:lipopolysaccharide biosynthesis protein n=1 Tax=Sphingorhabdus rigui TaxID=1282858 RepID=UPI0031D2320D
MVRNATSSMFALVWLNLLSILAIPLYIKILGVSEWGIVAACVSLQIIANFVDAGFSQIVPRWVATAAGNIKLLRSYLILFRRIFFVLALFIFILLQSSASYLAHDWFVTSLAEAEALELAIRIFAFQLFFQFINSLYIGFWFGMAQQVAVNARTCLFGTIKHVVAISVLFFIQSAPWLYTLIFAAVAFLELAANFQILERVLRDDAGSHAETAVFNEKLKLNHFLKEVLILSVSIIIGLSASQLDRIVLSATLSVKELGIYAVMFSVAAAVLQLQSPWMKANFPNLVKNVKENTFPTASQFLIIISGCLVFGLLPCFIVYTYCDLILDIWLNNNDLRDAGKPVLKILMISIGLNSIYSVLYQIIIASSKDKIVLAINIFSTGTTLVFIIFADENLGVLLGGYIWLVLTTSQLICGLIWLLMQFNSRYRQSRN